MPIAFDLLTYFWHRVLQYETLWHPPHRFSAGRPQIGHIAFVIVVEIAGGVWFCL
jgi:hypothetical protein